MLNVRELADQDTCLKKKSINEYAGSCPGCGGRDRFSIKVDSEGRWVFQCRGCWDASEMLAERGRKRGWGDEVDYLVHYRQTNVEEALLQALKEQIITFEQAYKRYAAVAHVRYEVAETRLLELGADGEQETIRRPERRMSGKQFNWQLIEWQKTTHRDVKECIDRLWSPEDMIALDYARRRGLSDDIIKRAQLGYSLDSGIPRLVIPAFNRHWHSYDIPEGHPGWYFTVYRRDLRSDLPGDEPRWKDRPGSTKNELYLADCLRRKRPTILTESAIDALSIIQECDTRLVNVVATGSADCCQDVKWLAELAFMPLVLVAFDADESGDKNAQWWLERLKNARRLRPFLHDVNDMLMQGWDVEQWVMNAVTGPYHRALRDEIERVRQLLHQGARLNHEGRRVVDWSVPASGFPILRDISPDDYCARILLCLTSDEPDCRTCALDDLAWQIARLMKQDTDRHVSPGQHYDQVRANLKTRLNQ